VLCRGVDCWDFLIGARRGDNKSDGNSNGGGNNVDDDGFSLVRGKGRRGGTAAKNEPDSRVAWGDEDSSRSESVAGNNGGRKRGESISSKAGSVAGESHTGWTEVSVSPWD